MPSEPASPEEGSKMVTRPLLEEVETSKGGKTPVVKTTAISVNDTGAEPSLDDMKDEINRMAMGDEFEEYNQDQVALSLCRLEINDQKSDIEVIRVFMKNKIYFDVFKDNFEEILKHPNLIIKIHDDLYNPDIGIPQIISLLAFNRVINVKTSEGMKKMQIAEEERKEIELMAMAPGPTRNIPEDAMPTLKDQKTVSSKKRCTLLIQNY